MNLEGAKWSQSFEENSPEGEDRKRKALKIARMPYARFKHIPEALASDNADELNVHEIALPAQSAQTLDVQGGPTQPGGAIFETLSATRKDSIADDNRREEKIGFIKKSERFLLDWVKSIYKKFEEKQDKKIEEKLQRPEKNKREIKTELQYAFFNAVGRNPIPQALIKLKYAIQLPGLIFDHLPVPIAFVGRIPILLSGVVVTVFFNIPNAIQAFSEKRYKKGLYELLVLSPISALIPVGHPLVNSFWQELFIFKPLEYRKNIKIIKHLEKIFKSDSQGEKAVQKAYKNYFEDLIEKKYRNKGLLHLFKKRTKEEMYLKMKEDIEKQIEHAEQSLSIVEKQIHGAEKRIEDLKKSDNSKKPTLKQHIIKFGKQFILLPINHAIAAAHKIQKEFMEYKLEVAKILHRVTDTEVNNNHSM